MGGVAVSGAAGAAGAGGAAASVDGGSAGEWSAAGAAGASGGEAGAGHPDTGGEAGVGATGGGAAVANQPLRCEPALSPILDGLLPTDAGVDATARTGLSADLDGDGRLDIALMNRYDEVAVVRGNGDGTLKPGLAFPTELSFVEETGSFDPAFLAVGDVNGDGRTDLVAANQDAAGVAVLLGAPGGVLAPSSVCALNGKAWGLVTGSFDGEGGDEIAVAYTDGDNAGIRVLSGNGSCATLWAGEGSVGKLGAGDVNADGKLDLLVYSGGLAVLLGDGTGAFALGEVHEGSGSATALVVEDLDRDGALDVAALGSCGRRDYASVFVRRGNGDGTFAPESAYYTGTCLGYGAAVDANGDGALDLVVSADLTLPGNGDGTFGPALKGPEALRGELVGSGDFDGDGRPDIAASAANEVVVRRGNGDGTFGAVPSFATDLPPAALALADLDGDGTLDIATGNAGSDYPDPDSVSVLLGNGDGTFAPHVTAEVARRVTALAVADMDGDSRPDLLVTSFVPAVLSVLLQTSAAHFAGALESALAGSPMGIAAGDLDGDGNQDVVTSLGVLRGAGDGTFLPAPDAASPQYPSVLLFDANGDQWLDLAGSSHLTDGSGGAWLHLGRGDGTFDPARVVIADQVLAMAAGDLNRDGHSDLVTSRVGLVSVLLGAGDGSFDEHSDYFGGGGDVAISDLDADGALDVIASQPGISVLKGRGDGTFECFQTYALGGSTGKLAAGDVNADGRNDVIALTRTGVSVFLNAPP
jgi:hypothetical protein